MPLPPPGPNEQDFPFTDLRNVPNGVTARVPRGFSVATAALPPRMPTIPGGAGSIVQNIKVSDTNKNLVPSFAATAPLTLFVRYNQSDLARAGGNKSNLKLYYYDGAQWIQFKDLTIVDDLVGNSPGYGRVTITDQWTADPPVGWGP